MSEESNNQQCKVPSGFKESDNHQQRQVASGSNDSPPPLDSTTSDYGPPPLVSAHTPGHERRQLFTFDTVGEKLAITNKKWTPNEETSAHRGFIAIRQHANDQNSEPELIDITQEQGEFNNETEGLPSWSPPPFENGEEGPEFETKRERLKRHALINRNIDIWYARAKYALTKKYHELKEEVEEDFV